MAEKTKVEVTTVAARIIALRDQLSRENLDEAERREITELISQWRLRLACLLSQEDFQILTPS